MKQLPNWVLTNRKPGIYDMESATVIEQTAKLYKAMQELIEEYNGDFTCLKTQLLNLMDDFITSMDLKIDTAVDYMQTNLQETVTNIVNQNIASGTYTVGLNYDETTENLDLIVTETTV